MTAAGAWDAEAAADRTIEACSHLSDLDPGDPYRDPYRACESCIVAALRAAYAAGQREAIPLVCEWCRRGWTPLNIGDDWMHVIPAGFANGGLRMPCDAWALHDAARPARGKGMA